jgi:hypothetical protein
MVLLDLEQGLYFELNEVGAAVWDGILEGRSLGEIARSLVTVYAAGDEQILADTRKLAEELEAAGLVTIARP